MKTKTLHETLLLIHFAIFEQVLINAYCKQNIKKIITMENFANH